MSRARHGEGVSGLLLVDKPAGMTSHDVVSRVRRLARTRQVGHTGTLDPDATGLLPVAIGICTRLVPFLLLDEKGYDFTMRLGEQTQTDDASGSVIAQAPWSHVTPEALREALAGFRGELMQQPPRYSAIRIDGKRAYAMAREGEDFELEARPVTVHELTLRSMALPDASLHMRCGSGTYVRSLVRDLGLALQTRAHTVSIRRTQVGPFMLEEAMALDDLLEAGPDRLHERLLPPAAMLRGAPVHVADDAQVEALGYGKSLPYEGPPATVVGIVDRQGSLVALGESTGQGVLKPRRVFVARD